MISSDWQSQIFEKKILVAQIGPNVLNQDQDEILRHFIEFES